MQKPPAKSTTRNMSSQSAPLSAFSFDKTAESFSISMPYFLRSLSAAFKFVSSLSILLSFRIAAILPSDTSGYFS